MSERKHRQDDTWIRTQQHQYEVPVRLPWDPPGSPLREKLRQAYEEDDSMYLHPQDRDWQHHHARTAICALKDHVDLPGLEDKLHEAFIIAVWQYQKRSDAEHTGYTDEYDKSAIVALQGLRNFGPHIFDIKVSI